MIGVVLWSDPVDRKAVFWCEDQGDLAYFEAADTDSSSAWHFDTGDMVQFDVRIVHRLRRAYDARVVLEKACTELPEKLRFSATGTASGGADSKIVDFKRPKSSARSALARSRKG